MEITEMRAEHGAAVLDIYGAGIEGGNATFETAVPGWAAFDASRLPGHRFVAVSGGDVLGWTALSPYGRRSSYDGVAHEAVYVHPDARGRGVGGALLAAVIGSSEDAGIWTLLAGIFPENTGSVRLHERHGFRLVGVEERIGRHDFGGTTRWRDVARYERRSGRVG